MIYWPAPIYRLIPWIYIVSGFITAYNFKSGIGFYSSLLLFAAGGRVLWMRFNQSYNKNAL